MTLQNVSIVLSPTMQISHRVLNSIFEHLGDLFSGVSLTPYIPPISGPSVKLPETLREIEEEMRKQESLLVELHQEISSGLVVAAREEQLWEQQRIVTQLKRNLRLAKVAEPACYEEELNFALQTPLDVKASTDTTDSAETEVEREVDRKQEGKSGDQNDGKDVAQPSILSSPDESGSKSQEHRITVQIHQDQSFKKDHTSSESVRELAVKNDVPELAVEAPSKGHVTVIQLNKSVEAEEEGDVQAGSDLSPNKQTSPKVASVASSEKDTTFSEKREVVEEEFVKETVVNEDEKVRQACIHKLNLVVFDENQVKSAGVSFSSTGLPPVRAPAAAAPSSIPLLPPPPPSR